MRWKAMNRIIVKNVVIKIKELKRNITSLPVSIEDVIFNQHDIEFVFPETNETLPYSDFLYLNDEYTVIVTVRGETDND
jgi:hypothetical protein